MVGPVGFLKRVSSGTVLTAIGQTPIGSPDHGSLLPPPGAGRREEDLEDLRVQ